MVNIGDVRKKDIKEKCELDRKSLDNQRSGGERVEKDTAVWSRRGHAHLSESGGERKGREKQQPAASSVNTRSAHTYLCQQPIKGGDGVSL